MSIHDFVIFSTDNVPSAGALVIKKETKVNRETLKNP